MDLMDSYHSDLFLLTMMMAAGGAAHVGNGAFEKIVKKCLFLLREALKHSRFGSTDGLMDPVVALPAFFQNEDPLAAAVFFVGADFDEAFFLQPGQKTGDGGMAQVEFRLNIPGAGRCFPVGEEAENGPLGGCQIHLRQRAGNGLIRAPVKHPNVMTKLWQREHLHNTKR